MSKMKNKVTLPVWQYILLFVLEITVGLALGYTFWGVS